MADSLSRRRFNDLENEAIADGKPLAPNVAATLVLADTLADTLIDAADKLEKVARDLERSLDSLDLMRDER
jgi:hypothetical protein